MAQKNLDFLDDLFKKLDQDTTSEINQSINEFGKEIRTSIDRSMKESGYDSFKDMITSEIEGGFSNKPIQKPTPTRFYTKQKIFQSRYDYLLDSLQSLEYDRKHRGYYKDGHQAALELWYGKAQACKHNLNLLIKPLDRDISKSQRDARQKRRDKYVVGYLDGLEFFHSELRQSKKYMMNKICNNLLLNE